MDVHGGFLDPRGFGFTHRGNHVSPVVQEGDLGRPALGHGINEINRRPLAGIGVNIGLIGHRRRGSGRGRGGKGLGGAEGCGGRKRLRESGSV